MKAALTKEEWALPLDEFCNERTGYASFGLTHEDVRSEYLTIDGEVGLDDRLALAARWLHEAGWFTHEDVRRHREAAEAARHVLSYEAERSQLQAPPSSGMAILGMQAAHNQLLDRLRWHTSMADRIAALIPPEEET
jgi:hypothetical protein